MNKTRNTKRKETWALWKPVVVLFAITFAAALLLVIFLGDAPKTEIVLIT